MSMSQLLLPSPPDSTFSQLNINAGTFSKKQANLKAGTLGFPPLETAGPLLYDKCLRKDILENRAIPKVARVKHVSLENADPILYDECLLEAILDNREMIHRNSQLFNCFIDIYPRLRKYILMKMYDARFANQCSNEYSQQMENYLELHRECMDKLDKINNSVCVFVLHREGEACPRDLREFIINMKQKMQNYLSKIVDDLYNEMCVLIPILHRQCSENLLNICIALFKSLHMWLVKEENVEGKLDSFKQHKMSYYNRVNRIFNEEYNPKRVEQSYWILKKMNGILYLRKFMRAGVGIPLSIEGLSRSFKALISNSQVYYTIADQAYNFSEIARCAGHLGAENRRQRQAAATAMMRAR